MSGRKTRVLRQCEGGNNRGSAMGAAIRDTHLVSQQAMVVVLRYRQERTHEQREEIAVEMILEDLRFTVSSQGVTKEGCQNHAE